MDNEFLLREVHEEFAGRMEDEHKRINHRLGKVEETIGEINRLTLSVQSLAESVQRMCKEQERQSERLQTLEDRDGDNWRALMKYLLTGIAGTLTAVVLGDSAPTVDIPIHGMVVY